MINIEKSNMFGKGNHRECYIHPENKNLCIKILTDTSLKTRQETRELKYYRHLQKSHISWEMISKYHGEVSTNLGQGSVFDLVTDQDGSVSKTLCHYISSNELTEKQYDDLASLLNSLKDYLLEQCVIGRYAARNIVCRRNESDISQLFIIDNIGNTQYIPIYNYNKFLARRKIIKRWNRFLDDMLNDYPHNKTWHRMLNLRG